MIYIRKEGETIRQGFNFYPLSDEGSFGFQLLFWKLRAELRWSKRAKRVAFRVWLKRTPQSLPEQLVYIPGYTEQLNKLYEDRFGWDGKSYADWEHDEEVEKQREREQAERNRLRDERRRTAK